MIDADLIIHARDRDSDLIPLLEKEEVSFAFSQLKYADFLIAGRIAIIKRTTQDFSVDLKNKMVYRNLPFFKREYAEPLYIIEGKDLAVNGTPLPTIRAAITHISSVGRVPIIRTEDAQETARYLALLVKQAKFSEPTTHRVEAAEANEEQPAPWQVELLMHLPDVDRVLAARMMKRFGTLRGVLDAKTSELQKIKGLGPKKSEKIKKALAAQMD
ncbi:MAG: ERCC4 domain-containing protein [bacterium]